MLKVLIDFEKKISTMKSVIFVND